MVIANLPVNKLLTDEQKNAVWRHFGGRVGEEFFFNASKKEKSKLMDFKIVQSWSHGLNPAETYLGWDFSFVLEKRTINWKEFIRFNPIQ